jgi:hypothetical protein
MKKNQLKTHLESVAIRLKIDENPLFDYYGKYTDELGPGVIVVAYKEFYEKLPAPMERDVDGRFYAKGVPDLPDRGREYRGFKPEAGGEKPGTKDFYKYGMQDFKRMQAYNRQEWCQLGVIAEATVALIHKDHKSFKTFESPGIWGIESDGGKDYFKEVAEEQLEQLKTILETFHVKTTGWQILAAKAIDDMEVNP